jgi:Tfp pilus assembly protein PilF
LSSIVYNPDWIALHVEEKGIVIDYFPELKGRYITNVTGTEYLALYYSNIAADAIAATDYNKAYWYLLEALLHAPTHGSALNMLAIVNRRTGNVATAERIYRYGIAYAEDKLSLLKNYHTLLVSEARNVEAQEIQLQLDTMFDPSPFHWLQLARESHNAGDWNGAISYYHRALGVAPNMHEAYLGLALSYYAAGRLQNAEQALIDAAVAANKVSTRTLYEAKLAALRKEF